jgi:hypothetical protein
MVSKAALTQRGALPRGAPGTAMERFIWKFDRSSRRFPASSFLAKVAANRGSGDESARIAIEMEPF